MARTSLRSAVVVGVVGAKAMVATPMVSPGLAKTAMAMEMVKFRKTQLKKPAQ